MKTTLIATAIIAVFAANGAWTCPDSTRFGNQTYEFSGQQLYDVQSFEVRAGGKYSIKACRVHLRDEGGDGWVTSSPDFGFNLSEMEKYEIVISVNSDCDSVLLIHTEDKIWFYDDDGNEDSEGDAQIWLTNLVDGWLDVWVGTYEGDSCDATLSLETFLK